LEVLEGVVDDEFEGSDLVAAVALVIADAADHALVDTLRLEADQVQHLSHVALTLRALRVFELFARHINSA